MQRLPRDGRTITATACAALFGLATLALTAVAQSRTADELYRGAEKDFTEMSYGTAADEYQALATKFPGDARAEEAAFKAALCRYRMDEASDAVTLLEPYVKAHQGSLWAAKARRVLVLAYGEANREDRERDLKLLQEAIDWLDAHREARENQTELVLCLFDYADKLPYDTEKEAERRALFLKQKATYNRIVELNVSADDTASATLHLAVLYLEHEDKPADWATGIELCRRVVAEWPNTAAAPEAQFHIASQVGETKQDYDRALEEWRTLSRRWPKSEYADAARTNAAAIVDPLVEVRFNDTATPGKGVGYFLAARNVKQVRLAAYATHPVKEFLELGAADLAAARADETPAKEWTVTIPDPSHHKPFGHALETPLLGPGTYHIVARDPNSKMDSVANVNVTSLVIVQAQDAGGKLLTWVSRRSDGHAVASVKLNYRYRIVEDGKQRYLAMGESTTDAQGLSSVTIPDEVNQKQVETLARSGDEAAWLENAYCYFSRDRTPETVGYITTDRPVYRPEQTVHFTASLRTFKGGEPLNLPGKSCPVVIRDARGEEALKTELTTDGFGVLHGDFTLGDSPALGMYQVSVKAGDQTCGGSFRVEEYKKPEFQVTVEPGGEDYKPGEKAAATIHAEYYFGGPVVGAKVTYTVKKLPFWPWYRFDRPFDWFFAGRDDVGWFRPRHREGDVVARGEAVTDATGKAAIQFDTAIDKDQDYEYQVQAEVTDQSRRTIEGATSLKVTRQSFYLHLDTVQSLYHAADKVTVNVKALTPNDAPVKTSGKLMVYQLVPSEREVKEEGQTRKEKYDDRKPILGEPLTFTTDAEGLAHVTFIPDRQGHFEVEVSSDDPKRPEPIKSTLSFWAVNDGFNGDNLDYTNLELITERDVYEKGETARVLINAPVKDRDVWVLIGGRDLATSQVLRLNGSARVLELPIRDGYAPDIVIEAYVVGPDQLYQTQKRLFVPPSDKFLKVSLATDKPKYRPREKGRFEVTALTKDGKPAKAEVCLAVTDESVYYVQSDLAQPIEQFFYARGRGGELRTWSSWQYEQVWSEHGAGKAGEAWGAGDGGESPPTAHMPALRPTATTAMPPPAPGAPSPAKEDLHVMFKSAAGGAEGQAMVEPTVRTTFADTCFWGPTLVTGPDGKAAAEVEFPDNLTTWRTMARALTTDTLVGQTQGKVVTSKDVIARLEMPRFLVQRDVATLSVIAHNYLDLAKNVRVELSAEGLKVTGDPSETVQVEKNGEQRVDRVVEAVEPGTARVTAKALTDVESDAMQLPLPILPHGVEKFAARAGQIAGEGAETIDLPAERDPASDGLVVQVTPSVAAGLLDALPYLAGYPWGCVEQTMNRFLPSVIVADTAKKLNLNTGDKLADVPRQVKAGLRRLYSQQNSDGGWGWWPGGSNDLYMTAYVLSGLLRAKAAGYEVSPEVLDKGLGYLRDQVKKEQERESKRLDTLAYAAYVLAQAGDKPRTAVDRVYASRDKLNEHCRALLALTLSYLKDDRCQVVMRNLVDYRIETDRGCHWGKSEWGWWWSEDQVEATAASLLALVRITPDSPLISKTVWWLVTNRKGADHWKSTKDTALALAALSEYLLASHEAGASYTASVYVNDKLVKAIEVTPQNALQLDGRVVVDRTLLKTGPNVVRLTKEGQGALYYALLATYYTKEEPIKGASSAISVTRQYYAIEEYVDDKQQLRARRTPLSGSVKSGTQIEVELTINSENDFDYVMFEDYKPAGCEPVDLQSGWVWGDRLSAYREFRDEKVGLFVDHLSQGKHTLTYRLRAETPGDFHALPNVGQGMYVPEVRCLSDEARVVIR